MQSEDLQQIKQILDENNKSLATKEDLDGLMLEISEKMATKEDLDGLATKEDLDNLALMVKNGFDGVDKRFEDVYSQLTSIDSRLALIQSEITDIKKSLAELEKRTIEDDNVLSGEFLNLQKRVMMLEKKVEQMARS